jgi:hypothetical protein
VPDYGFSLAPEQWRRAHDMQDWDSFLRAAKIAAGDVKPR